MASAWPMIRRCKIAQWKGLTSWERDDAAERWERDGDHPASGVLSQHEISLWDNEHMILMSIKEDRVSDEIMKFFGGGNR